MNRSMEKEKQPLFTLPKEMGFQSYELLDGKSGQRDITKKAFMAGSVRNPTLDYPFLAEKHLVHSINNLEPVFNISQQYDDETLSEVVWNSASYRMAEMYWLLEAKRLNELAIINPYSDEFRQSAARYQEANEQLYGRPSEILKEAVYGEVLAQANEKQLHPSAQNIYDQLVNGTTIYLEKTQLRVPGIGEAFTTRLPQDVKEQLGELNEILKEQFADVFRIVNEYWNNVVLQRDADEPAFEVDDMRIVFESVRDFYDPGNTAGISVVIDSNATQLSWDTPTSSVRVGGRRRKITESTEMIAKVIHEYCIHGLRMVNGKKANVPTLDTGMYSDAKGNERSDYLTFEEGFASLSEMAIDDSFAKWKSMHLSHALALNARYEGNDFRQTYERTWRARVLLDVKDGDEVTDKILQTAQKQAYISCVRVMRGTPVQLPDGPVLTFNKDLAYLSGKLDALRYLDEHKGDRQAITRLFLGKFDPNNHIQNSIVERYVENK